MDGSGAVLRHSEGAHADGRDSAAVGSRRPALLKRVLTVDTVCALLVVIITLLMFAGVVFRYVLAQPLVWADEVVRYSFTWLSFMSAALAMKYHGHMALDLLNERLPGRARLAKRIVIELLLAVFLVLFAYYGFRMAVIAHGQTSSALQIPISVVYAAAPVASLLMLAYAIRNIIQVWTGRQQP